MRAARALALYWGGPSQARSPPCSCSRKTWKCPPPRRRCRAARKPIPTAAQHFVNGRALKGPYPQGLETAIFGLGCFWGAERKFWELGDGIHVTAVGYAGGLTPNPTYEEVCSGRTGHNEVVLVVYDPPGSSPTSGCSKTFWESHDPTQGMRQGNDVGTQYRSGIYVTSPAQRAAAEASKAAYAKAHRGARLRRHHDRDPRCARILFRRGLSPAVSGQEPDAAIAGWAAPA